MGLNAQGLVSRFGNFGNKHYTSWHSGSPTAFYLAIPAAAARGLTN